METIIFNKDNSETVIRQFKKQKVAIPTHPLAKTIAFLINNGDIANVMDIAWADFEGTLFFTHSKGGPEDMLLIDSIEDARVKIAVLDYWINHQDLIMTSNPFFIDMYGDLQKRPIIWRQTKDALVNKTNYDIRRVLDGQPDYETQIETLEKRVAQLEGRTHFKYLIKDKLKPEQLAEVEIHLRNACAANAPAAVRSLCKWQVLDRIEYIEDVTAIDIFDALASCFQLNFKLNAFQKAWSNRHKSQK